MGETPAANKAMITRAPFFSIRRTATTHPRYALILTPKRTTTVPRLETPPFGIRQSPVVDRLATTATPYHHARQPSQYLSFLTSHPVVVIFPVKKVDRNAWLHLCPTRGRQDPYNDDEWGSQLNSKTVLVESTLKVEKLVAASNNNIEAVKRPRSPPLVQTGGVISATALRKKSRANIQFPPSTLGLIQGPDGSLITKPVYLC
ncbi:hypothetical protein ACLB2K_056392 [Fragaria x ananassa]